MPRDVPPFVQCPVLPPDLNPHLVASVAASEEATGDDVVLARSNYADREETLDMCLGSSSGDTEREDVTDPFPEGSSMVKFPQLDTSGARGKYV